MDTLSVRIYNVEFGDAILVSVPDRDSNDVVTMRHILIDCGNALIESKGGHDEVFNCIISDVLKKLDGCPLDLYVMTHEHMDHIQGLPYCESKFYNQTENQLRDLLKTRFAWLTVSSAKEYYTDGSHPEAAKRLSETLSMYEKVDNCLNVIKASGENLSEELLLLWKNNNPRKTANCVEYLRGLAKETFFVSRGFGVGNAHPFNEAKFEIWGPENDTASYSSKMQSHSVALEATAHLNSSKERTSFSDVTPLPGVDGSAFYNLVDMRKNALESLLSIDQNTNNSSVVFLLEWRGYRLLFTGDAERLSWKKMDEAKVLKPVHFIKVGHHGSYNGTPVIKVLEKVIPFQPPDNKPRYAGVSTSIAGDYENVPDEDTLKLFSDRCSKLYRTDNSALEPGDYIDIDFSA